MTTDPFFSIATPQKWCSGKFFDKYLLNKEKRDCVDLYRVLCAIFSRAFELTDVFSVDHLQISGTCVGALQFFFEKTMFLPSLEFVESTKFLPIYQESGNIHNCLVQLNRFAQHLVRTGFRRYTAEDMLTHAKLFKDWANCLFSHNKFL
jgi:hypothetical protein